MTHLEHHVTHHVTNNLKFESSYLVNQIKWIIQSATSLKTDNLSKLSLSRTRTRPNPNVVDWYGHEGRREQKPESSWNSRPPNGVNRKGFLCLTFQAVAKSPVFRKKKSDKYIRSFLFDFHVMNFSLGNPRNKNFKFSRGNPRYEISKFYLGNPGYEIFNFYRADPRCKKFKFSRAGPRYEILVIFEKGP